MIISAVTADQSLIAARSLLPHLVQGQVVIDLNSVSPGRKRETAVEVTAAGGAYLDMAVMAPVHPRGHRTPVLLVITGTDAGRLPQATEVAAYQAVAEAVRRAAAIGDARVDLALEREGTTLRLAVVGDDLGPGPWTRVSDRVGAAGGTLGVEGHEGRTTRLTMELPCA